jgi:hypothetical protein
MTPRQTLIHCLHLHLSAPPLASWKRPRNRRCHCRHLQLHGPTEPHHCKMKVAENANAKFKDCRGFNADRTASCSERSIPATSVLFCRESTHKLSCVWSFLGKFFFLVAHSQRRSVCSLHISSLLLSSSRNVKACWPSRSAAQQRESEGAAGEGQIHTERVERSHSSTGHRREMETVLHTSLQRMSESAYGCNRLHCSAMCCCEWDL